MSRDILNIGERIIFDESIASKEFHSYQPYASAQLNNNDEIRICIQRQDLCVLPCDSYIYIEGRLRTDDNKKPEHSKFIRNGIMHLFEEIRYEIGGIVIDRVRNPGITTTLKSYVSYSVNESTALNNAGWFHDSDTLNNFNDSEGNFSVCIPLRMIFGFAEDFNKVLLNLRQDLVLLRDSTDQNAVFTTSTTEKPKVILTKVTWNVPHILLADVEKLKLLKYIDSNTNLNIPFRAWELHEYPVLPQTRHHAWVVKTTSQLEKPRHILFGFQTARKNKYNGNMSLFDHCSLTNIKVELNSQVYPYDNLNLNFNTNHISILYQMYAEFQQSYYKKQNEPLFSPNDFKTKCPIASIDCSYQNESLKDGVIDLKITFQTTDNLPAETSGYALILYDKIVKYNPLTNIVRIA